MAREKRHLISLYPDEALIHNRITRLIHILGVHLAKPAVRKCVLQLRQQKARERQSEHNHTLP